MTVDPVRALASLEPEAYLVGGAVRDRLLGRPTTDFDVAIKGSPREVARALARSAGGHAFELSEGFGGWRVVARDRTWQLDVLALAGGDIEADLAQRDFAVNAMAHPVEAGLEAIIDPFGGRDDAAARRLRMVSEAAFGADPLRVLRAVRLAGELGFTLDPATVRAARAARSGLTNMAAERIFAELKRIVAGPHALSGLSLLDELGATPVVLPELSALQGVTQSAYHHLDVAGHTREVLAAVIEQERHPETWWGRSAEVVDAFMRAPLANELTRWQALRFGALLHDIAKPQTRAVTAEGRTTFMAHDVAGAEVAGAVLKRLRASQRLVDHVMALTRHHLRLGFLVHDVPLSRRAVYAYLRACEPVEVDVTVLSVADRLATRGRGSAAAIDRHLALARDMVADALRWRADRPRPPIRGHELARALDLAPGPQLGSLLRELEAASYAGEIGSAEEAIAHARARLERSE